MYIKILWAKIGILKREINYETDIPGLEGLQFNLDHGSERNDPKEWAFSITQNGNIIIKTDGYSYIDYFALGKKYVKHFYTFKDLISTIFNYFYPGKKRQVNWGVEVLYCGDDAVTISYNLKKEIRHLKDVLNEVFFNVDATALLYGGYVKGERYYKIEGEINDHHQLALGLVAFKWVRDEYLSNITG